MQVAAAASRRVLGDAHPSTEHFAQGLRSAATGDTARVVSVEEAAALKAEEMEMEAEAQEGAGCAL